MSAEVIDLAQLLAVSLVVGYAAGFLVYALRRFSDSI